MDLLIGQILGVRMTDTLHNSQDTINYWIAKIPTPGAGVWLADNYLAAGDSLLVQQTLDTLSARYGADAALGADIAGLKSLFTWMWMHRDEEKGELSPTDATFLMPFAESSEWSFSRDKARNMLSFFDIHFTPELVLPELPEERMRREDEKAAAAQAAAVLRVYPNPAEGQAVFDWSGAQVPLTDLRLSVFDPGGALVYTSQINDEARAFVWHNSRKSFFVYRLTAREGVVGQGKLLFR